MLKLCSFLLIFIIPWPAPAAGLPDQWQSLYQQLWQTTPVTISRQTLNAYPQQLLLSSAQYPDFKTYSWQDITTLRQVSLHCRPPGQNHQHLKTAIAFELKLCRHQQPNINWFSTHARRHPAGGSYADHYIRQQTSGLFPDALKQYLTADNPLHPLHQRFSQISTQGRDQLLKGARAWLQQNTLWLSGETGWKKVPVTTWQPLAKQRRLTLTNQQTQCAFRYSNLCINPLAETPLMQPVFIALLLICLLFVLLRNLVQRRQQSQERQFIFRLLTHELRTPITSLGLTVEMFRHEFDQVNEPTQQAIWRLIADQQRLARMAEISQGYLSSGTSQQFMKQKAFVRDWLEYTCEKHQLSFQLNHDAELELPYYWLSVCLDNLIKNARQHGKGDIEITVTLTATLRIEVKDQGHFPPAISQLLRLRKPAPDQNNMGIGLHLVRRLMKQMGGTFTIRRLPTRCILELPL